MKSRGHDVFVAAREKEITCYLLEKYKIPYYRVASHHKAIGRKIFGYFTRWARTYQLCKRIKPDIALGVGDFYLPQIGRVLGFPAVVITDTEAAVHDAFLTFPFASSVLTPTCYQKKLKNQILYNSYKELAYLGKRWFTPDPKVYELLGIKEGQRYIIIRFTGRTAVHDIGCRGLTPEMKYLAVKEFSKYARVFISSEQKLSEDLEKYQLPCLPEQIHHALYYADLLYGDSATMASEAACLGTPAIYIDDKGRGYTHEQERKYGLVFNFQNTPEDRKKSIQKGISLLTEPGIAAQWQKKRERMLGDKIELTDFLVQFVLESVLKGTVGNKIKGFPRNTRKKG